MKFVAAAEKLSLADEAIRLASGPGQHGRAVEGDLLRIISGGLALDVGGGDGRYVKLIEAFGAERVVVDPQAERIQQGIEGHAIKPDCGFVGTIEAWAAAGTEPAQAAFAINLQPRLGNDEGFWRGLAGAVVSGGFAVASSTEPGTGLQACAMANRNGLKSLDLAGPSRIRPAAGFYAVYFWQKIVAA